MPKCDRKYKSMFSQQYYILPALIFISAITNRGECSLSMEVMHPSPSDREHSEVFKHGALVHYYNDTIYNDASTCENGQLSILQFEAENNETVVKIRYDGQTINGKQDFKIDTKFDQPKIKFELIDTKNSIVHFRATCLHGDNPNYYNKVDIVLKFQYRFSFLLNCDKGGKKKVFELGYLLLTVLNAAITIGVALHSKIWSIRYQNRPLSIELKWYRFLFIILVIGILGTLLFFYSATQFQWANIVLKLAGLAIGFFYTFICSNEFFFLYRKFKKQICGLVRICDILSLFTSIGLVILALLADNWICYDIIGVGICVGAIKLFRFSSMKQAFLSMGFSIIFVTGFSTFLHFTLDRSYNDYASQLSSPLFITIPDLVQQLYKKCSWLPVVDVIIPGVFLSFLRTYDQNYNTGWGGVYTVMGNLIFVSSTLLWVALQAIYPYSIPFCLITYTSLSFVVWLISYRRNDFKTLWEGRFNGANNQLIVDLLKSEGNSDTRQSFGKLVTSDLIQSIKIHQDENSFSENDNYEKENLNQQQSN